MKNPLVLVVLFLACFTLDAGAAPAEEPSRNVLSSVDLELHGRIKADGAYDDSETFPGNFVLWTEKETPGNKNRDQYNMTANETRLWMVLKGPRVGGLKTGGKVEVDFYGAGAAENKAHLMLRRAYVDFGWEEYGLSFLAGQTSDVISPLVVYTLNYTVGWDIGNIGYRRPQFRVTKVTDLGYLGDLGPIGLDVDAAISRTVGGETLAGVDADYGEQGMPTFQGRVGLRLPSVGAKPMALGFSSHYGKERVDNGTFERELETYSFNMDGKIPIHLDQEIGPCGLDFELSGELFYGANLNSYFGGIGQGVNIATIDKVRSNGGWGQLAYQGIPQWRFVVGGGVDNPYNTDLPATGRTSNEFVFANVVHNLTRQLQVGVEYLFNKTEFFDEQGKNNRVQLSVIYHF